MWFPHLEDVSGETLTFVKVDVANLSILWGCLMRNGHFQESGLPCSSAWSAVLLPLGAVLTASKNHYNAMLDTSVFFRMSLAKSSFLKTGVCHLRAFLWAIPRRCKNSSFQHDVITFIVFLMMSQAKSSFSTVARALLEPSWGHFLILISSSWSTSNMILRWCCEHLIFWGCP